MDYKDYNETQLVYFKELIEGRAAISWRAWWNSNQSILKSQLKRPEYIRLKFGLVEYAYKILEENKISTKWGVFAKKESYYANLHESVLDENGRLKESSRRCAYDGACGDFLDGEVEKGTEKLNKYIAYLKEMETIKSKSELEGMAFDGEMMINSGIDYEFGKAVLEAVLSYGLGDDLTDFAIETARGILDELENA